MSLILIYITYPTEEEAQKIVAQLLKKKLIACATVFPVKSAYWWRGKIEQSREFVSWCKTKAENWHKIKEEVKKLHSYQVPCLLKFSVEANSEYNSWLLKDLS